jgi:hypothetical protein
MRLTRTLGCRPKGLAPILQPTPVKISLSRYSLGCTKRMHDFNAALTARLACDHVCAICDAMQRKSAKVLTTQKRHLQTWMQQRSSSSLQLFRSTRNG